MRKSPVCIELINLSRNQATNHEVVASSERQHGDDAPHDVPTMGENWQFPLVCQFIKSARPRTNCSRGVLFETSSPQKISVSATDPVTERSHLVGRPCKPLSACRFLESLWECLRSTTSCLAISLRCLESSEAFCFGPSGSIGAGKPCPVVVIAQPRMPGEINFT